MRTEGTHGKLQIFFLLLSLSGTNKLRMKWADTHGNNEHKIFNARDLHVRAIHISEEIKMDFTEIYSKNKKWIN
jgi:hypothetical protein